MTDENNKKSNEPISISLKVVIYLGIVSGIFLGSWEIVNNIPKYEFKSDEGGSYIFNKSNGAYYKRTKIDQEDGLIVWKQITKIEQ